MKATFLLLVLASTFFTLSVYAQADGRPSELSSASSGSSSSSAFRPIGKSEVDRFLDEERKDRAGLYKVLDSSEAKGVSTVFHVDLSEGFTLKQEKYLRDQMGRMSNFPDKFAIAIKSAGRKYDQNPVIAFVQKEAEKQRRKNQEKVNSKYDNKTIASEVGVESRIENSEKEQGGSKTRLKLNPAKGEVKLVFTYKW